MHLNDTHDIAAMWQSLPNEVNGVYSDGLSASDDDVATARELPLASDGLAEDFLELTAASNHSNTCSEDVSGDGRTILFDLNVAGVLSEINGLHESDSVSRFDTDGLLLELNVKNLAPILLRSQHSLNSNISASEANDSLHVFANMNINRNTSNPSQVESNSQTFVPYEDTEIELLSSSQRLNAVSMVNFQDQLPTLHHLGPALFYRLEREPKNQLPTKDIPPPQANKILRGYLQFEITQNSLTLLESLGEEIRLYCGAIIKLGGKVCFAVKLVGEFTAKFDSLATIR
jgi:hypothetical protein